MADTIGRVDYIADLDGRNLPRKAEQLGHRAGQAGGKGFADSFDREVGGTFERKLTNIGESFANKLSSQGRLAGSKFSQDFESAVSTRFRSIQRNLADILSNRESFQDFARGFDTVDEAVERLNSDLEALVGEKYRYVDAAGRARQANVLTERDFERYSRSVSRLGDEFRVVVAEEERAAAAAADLEDRHRILMHRLGNLDAFRAYAKELGSNTAAYHNMRDELDKLSARMGTSAAEHEILGERLRKITSESRRASFEILDLSKRWQSLGHNTRQWTLIIGAVAAGMQHLSVLSSALGAGLFALGGAITPLVAGAGGLIATFSALDEDIAQMPPHMRDVVSEFDDFKGAASGVRDVIASSAFRQMPGTFSSLASTTRALSPQFSRLGTVVGETFDDLADGLKEGTDGFDELSRLISNSTEDFPALARATGTWATALMRGLNEANPLTDQLIGYFQLLGDRVNAFTRSSSFDDWIATSSQTFTEFGELLDATGRMLNDLVTPASAVRTQEFLNSLTEFMPNLGRLLDVLGRADVFGLVAQGLNDIGQALEPLYEPSAELADAFNDIASVAIGALADGLGAVATVATPVASALADVLDALPPDVVAGLALSVGGLALSFKVLQGASGLAGAANAALVARGSFGRLALATGAAEAATSRWAGGMKSLAGKAGVIGAVGAAVGLALPMVNDWAKGVYGFGENAREAAAGTLTLEESVRKVISGHGALSGAFTDARSALEELVAVQKGGDFARWVGDIFSANQESYALSLALGELDSQLSILPLDAAIEKFRGYAESVGASDAEVAAMLEEMPKFAEQMRLSAAATGDLASAQDIARMAMGDASTAASSQEDVISLLTGSLTLNGQELDTLSAKMQEFTEKNLTTRSASREFESSIDELTETLKTNGAQLDATGKEFDITTEKGRANQEMVDRLAESTIKLSEDILDQTGSQKQANDAIAKGREELIKQLGVIGITGQAAEDYADKLGLIPSDIATRVALENAAAVEAELNHISRRRSVYIDVHADGSFDFGNRRVTPFATGGTVFGPTNALIGESGPEAVVPLDRPLHQVDPSVRLLSAIAQGKVPALAGGGIGTPASKMININEGAIVVQGAQDPRRAALEVVDAIAEWAAS